MRGDVTEVNRRRFLVVTSRSTRAAIVALACVAAPVTTQCSPTGSHRDRRAHTCVAATNTVRISLREDTSIIRATNALGLTALDWVGTEEHWHIFRQPCRHILRQPCHQLALDR